jgi:hypothetical protein
MYTIKKPLSWKNTSGFKKANWAKRKKYAARSGEG